MSADHTAVVHPPHEAAHAHGHDAGMHHAHVSPVRVLVNTFVALLVLTVVTVAVSRIHFGTANMLVAVAIAAVKVGLVMVFFMHLRHDTVVNILFIVSSFIFLSLLFLFTLSDRNTRADTDRSLVDRTPVVRYEGYAGKAH
jgi:cytochrome c oxidase subunit 4